MSSSSDMYYAFTSTYYFPKQHPFLQLCFFTLLMSQMRWFHKLSSVILIILVHYWDYQVNHRCCCAHHCITDDLNKSNEQMTQCFDYARYFLCMAIYPTISSTPLFLTTSIFCSFCRTQNFMIRKT